jgi:hypothetical protein
VCIVSELLLFLIGFAPPHVASAFDAEMVAKYVRLPRSTTALLVDCANE